MSKYISQTDLENALSVSTVLAIFDDGTGTVNSTAVAAVIDRAEAEVDSYLIVIYDLPLPNQADRLLKHCALQFAICFAMEKHPEYVRTFGEQQRTGPLYERAHALMTRIAKALQRLPDQTVAASNVGGDTTSVADDLEYPTPPKTFFTGMGDF